MACGRVDGVWVWRHGEWAKRAGRAKISARAGRGIYIGCRRAGFELRRGAWLRPRPGASEKTLGAKLSLANVTIYIISLCYTPAETTLHEAYSSRVLSLHWYSRPSALKDANNG
jgi:hypothetical protein